MFLKSSSRVKWNGKISKPIKNRYGVMQGGVLSPKLFNEFLQDLGKYLNPKYGLKIGDIYLAYLLFADDIVLFSEFVESLQAQIDLFYKYCEIWNLIISIAKTKIVIYNQIYAKHSFSFTLAENTLEIVDKYKYLGLWGSKNKNIFVKNHSYLAEQARKAIFPIRNYSHNLGHLTPKLSLKVKPQKPPLEQRICHRCTSNSVDDEIYFLITCSYFAT